MALSMRLSRGGRKSRPFYRVVVADKRMPRDGRYIEKLGTYNPLLANDDEKRVVLNEERIKYWLGQGAQPSHRVQIFLSKAGLMDMPEIRETPKKSAPSEKTKMKLEEKTEKLKSAAEAAKAAAEAPAPVEEPAPAEAEAPVEEPKAEETPEAEAKEEPAAEEKPAEAPKAEAPAPEAETAPAEEPKAEEQPAPEVEAVAAPAEEAKAEEEKKEG